MEKGLSSDPCKARDVLALKTTEYNMLVAKMAELEKVLVSPPADPGEAGKNIRR